MQRRIIGAVAKVYIGLRYAVASALMAPGLLFAVVSGVFLMASRCVTRDPYDELMEILGEVGDDE